MPERPYRYKKELHKSYENILGTRHKQLATNQNKVNKG